MSFPDILISSSFSLLSTVHILSSLWSTFTNTSYNSLIFYPLKSFFLSLIFWQSVYVFAEAITMSFSKISETKCHTYLLSFTVFKDWKKRETFQLPTSTRSQFCCGYDSVPIMPKKLANVMWYKGRKRKEVKLFRLPKSLQFCNAADWDSADPKGFTSITAHVHLSQESGTNGRAGQVPILLQICGSQTH